MKVLYDWVSRASVLVRFSIKFFAGRDSSQCEGCQQGVVELVWKMRLKMMVNNNVGLRHWTLKQEDPLYSERIVPTSFCFPLHVFHVASDKHTVDRSWNPSVLC
nr:hypothetical protein [Tanacetum cinerariifolium]